MGILAGDQSFLLVNGSPIAKCEVLVFEKTMGLRIAKIFDEEDTLRLTRGYFGT